MRGILLTLSVAAVAFGIGSAVAPKEQLDHEVRHVGVFGLETSRILSTTVENLQSEGRLVVYSYKGAAQVETGRVAALGLIRGRQFLSVPGTASYHLDLADLGMEDVRLDERTKTLFVTLPQLQLGAIAMVPDFARMDNSGVLTISDDVVQDMARANYHQARCAFIAQAQQAAITGLARRQAEQLVARHFELPLRAAGLTDIHVRVQVQHPEAGVAIAEKA